MEIEIGDLVRWHSSEGFLGIVVDIQYAEENDLVCDRAFVYWFTAAKEIKELIGGMIGAGWEPMVFLRLHKKK